LVPSALRSDAQRDDGEIDQPEDQPSHSHDEQNAFQNYERPLEAQRQPDRTPRQVKENQRQRQPHRASDELDDAAVEAPRPPNENQPDHSGRGARNQQGDERRDGDQHRQYKPLPELHPEEILVEEEGREPFLQPQRLELCVQVGHQCDRRSRDLPDSHPIAGTRDALDEKRDGALLRLDLSEAILPCGQIVVLGARVAVREIPDVDPHRPIEHHLQTPS
jgi:hypothetical protein